MMTLQVSDLSLAFGDRDILRNVNLNLDEKSRTALTGANGSGKTSLMNLIRGELETDGGRLICSKGLRTGYLPQSGLQHRGRRLIDEAESAFDRHLQSLKRKEAIEAELEQTEERDPRLQPLLAEHHSIVEDLMREDYDRRFEAIERVLQGLGFLKSDFHRPCEVFSGGWQMRIALAKVLLQKPHILLLDEPTNYLDLEARNWLQNFLGDYPGGLLIVSHDRHFLDSVVGEVVEIFNADLRRYRGNYSEYERVRRQELISLTAAYEKQQEEISKLEEFIDRFRYNASKAKLVQSRIKQLEKIDRIVIPETLKKIRFSFPPPPHSGREMLRIRGLGKRYGDKEIFSNFDYLVQRGEKLVLTGANGAGKSTLLRIIAGVDQEYEGALEYGTDVKIGYFSQEREEFAGSTRTIIEEMEADAPTELIPELRNLLGAFLFRGDDIHKPISVLSGGEKSRLALMKLLLRQYNLLILDEPTNHLDLHSKDVLLESLKRYSGTVIFVSHDFGFIQALANRVLQMKAGVQPRDFQDDYNYYLWKTEQEALEEEGEPSPGKSPEQSPERSESKLSWEEAKKRKNRLKELEREEVRLMEEIEQAELRSEELDETIAKPEVYSDPDKVRRVQAEITANTRYLEELNRNWDKLSRERAEHAS